MMIKGTPVLEHAYAQLDIISFKSDHANAFETSNTTPSLLGTQSKSMVHR